ncbi:MAG TPA: S-layer homology domain-containing protein [bacterium]|nr:S-layer homology domain-containing protein [bacterium]
MRHIAVAVAAAVMFAMVAPAFAQPFADVPTNHWAYDAIAELAAKGLVEGYPDGTFKGDRAMTRYEMAMVVARLLARIESIQIPAPAPAPQVTKADLDALQRLINEFRAELAALGVRVTAIEEELNAIKARLDNVKITGRYRFRYDGSTSFSGASVNGNINTGSTAAGSTPNLRARMGGKLMFDGSVAPDIHAIIGLELSSAGTSTPVTFDSAGYGGGGVPGAGASCAGNGTPCYQFANIAELYLDWNHAWGWPLRIQLGRMGGLLNGFGMLPLQFGPHGLLVNSTSDTYGASTGDAGLALWDGLRLSGNVPSWADFNWQAAVWRVIGPTGGGSYFLGEDAYGVDANIRIIPGLRVGGYWVANNINAASSAFPSNATSALWHVYGNISTPLTNPPTAMCPAVGTGTLPAAAGGGTAAGGIECHALGSGGGGYATWNAVPGITVDGEIAWWNDGTAGITDSAYYVDAVVDLGAMTGIGHKLALTLSYENAGVNFYAPYQSDVDYDISGSVGPGNAQLFTADLSFDITDQWGFLGAYITGNNISNGMGITEWRAGVVYRFAPGASIYTRWEQQNINGVLQYTLWRSELNYNF